MVWSQGFVTEIHQQQGESRGPCSPATTGSKTINLCALTMDKVCRYHAEYYTSNNCILILTGNVQSKDVFVALDEVKALVLQPKITTEVEAKDSRLVGRP